MKNSIRWKGTPCLPVCRIEPQAVTSIAFPDAGLSSKVPGFRCYDRGICFYCLPTMRHPQPTSKGIYFNASAAPEQRSVATTEADMAVEWAGLRRIACRNSLFICVSSIFTLTQSLPFPNIRISLAARRSISCGQVARVNIHRVPNLGSCYVGAYLLASSRYKRFVGAFSFVSFNVRAVIGHRPCLPCSPPNDWGLKVRLET